MSAPSLRSSNPRRSELSQTRLLQSSPNKENFFSEANGGSSLRSRPSPISVSERLFRESKERSRKLEELQKAAQRTADEQLQREIDIEKHRGSRNYVGTPKSTASFTQRNESLYRDHFARQEKLKAKREAEIKAEKEKLEKERVGGKRVEKPGILNSITDRLLAASKERALKVESLRERIAKEESEKIEKSRFSKKITSAIRQPSFDPFVHAFDFAVENHRRSKSCERISSKYAFLGARE